jgi:hypothetical protein
VASLLDAPAEPMASCAGDDNPTSIRAKSAAVLTPEVGFMSASSRFRQGTFVASRCSEKGAFLPGFLRARATQRMLAP